MVEIRKLCQGRAEGLADGLDMGIEENRRTENYL